MLRETKVETGKVRGLPGTDARITVYKGIPYAAPPVGPLRWKAPQPAEAWEGTRNCFEFGPINFQKVPGKDPNAFYSKEWHVDPDVPMSEDCLYLNVWTPAKTGDEKLPVMVWIFGGGYQEGYSYEMEFDGERIASRGVVLVTIGYRLNVFGFLSHPDLTAEDPEAPTNFGSLDQLSAIKWVGRNIANFGGDPENITIFGQSAGGDGVCSQVCSPLAKGAFKRAIIQSNGGFTISAPWNFLSSERLTLPESEAKGKKFLEECLGVTTIEEARKLDAQYIYDKQAEYGLFAVPTVDGKFLNYNMPRAIMKDEINDVQIMMGNTVDEFPIGPSGETEEEIAAWAKEAFPDNAEEYMAIVKKHAADNNLPLKKAANVYTHDVGMQVAIKYLAEHGKNPYYYRFGPTIPGDNAGAFHSSELWFTFETLMKCWRPFDGHHFDLSRKMCNYWTNFAKYGDPNGLDADGTPMPRWEKYTVENEDHMNFYDEVTPGQHFDEKSYFLSGLNRELYEKR